MSLDLSSRKHHLTKTRDDTSELTIAAAVPLSQTVLEYLVGCWKRLNTHRLTLLRRGLGQQQLTQASGVLEHLRDLVISYAGLTLQDPTMFPQPNKYGFISVNTTGLILQTAKLLAHLNSCNVFLIFLPLPLYSLQATTLFSQNLNYNHSWLILFVDSSKMAWKIF